MASLIMINFCTNQNIFFKVIYVVPACASETPASGDGNLLGNLCKMQEEFDKEAIKILAGGSSKFFPVFICDTGFQMTGKEIC